MLSTRWILCIFPSVAKERERDATFLFLLFIRVFILFICIFILEYICRNISDVLNIQRKCYYWISLFLPQMLKIFILTPKTEVSVLLFSFQAATHSHTTSKTFFCFSFLFFFFLFKRAAHFLLTIPLVVSSHVFTCPIAGGRHESVIVALQWPKLVSQAISSGFPAIKKKLVLKQRKTVKPVGQKRPIFCTLPRLHYQ